VIKLDLVVKEVLISNIQNFESYKSFELSLVINFQAFWRLVLYVCAVDSESPPWKSHLLTWSATLHPCTSLHE